MQRQGPDVRADAVFVAVGVDIIHQPELAQQSLIHVGEPVSVTENEKDPEVIGVIGTMSEILEVPGHAEVIQEPARVNGGWPCAAAHADEEVLAPSLRFIERSSHERGGELGGRRFMEDSFLSHLHPPDLFVESGRIKISSEDFDIG